MLQCQLQSCVVQKITTILKAKESSYYPASQDIFKEVEDVLIEAQDTDLCLRLLEKHIQLFWEMEFPKIRNLIPPLFHTICLIRNHSEFYSMPAGVIVLLREFCNLLIDHVASNLQSPEAAFISEKYVEMLTFFDQYEDQTSCEQKVQVDEICQFNLDGPLIKRNPENSPLSMNFDPKCIGNLELIAQLYNRLMQTTLELEYPLIEIRLSKVKDLAGLFKTSRRHFIIIYTTSKGKEHSIKANQELEKLEKEMLLMLESTKLFEVAFPDYKQKKQCKEVQLLKKSNVDDWAKTQWRQINVEQMDVELRRFAKEMCSLDKEVGSWDVYRGLELNIKNLMLSLRAILELQNPAVRERHWLSGHECDGGKYSAKEISVMVFHALPIDATVKLLVAEDTTLTDLLGLQLHKVEDEVQSIADNAMKQFGTEKLQNILKGKYAVYFIEQVKHWQNKLNMADSVISIWMEVQHMWSHLESISLGMKLSEDSCLKMQTDLMKSTETSKLSLCEKALAEYLENKRIAFPHFYLISSTDWLDILLKRTQPKQVAHYLTNIADLKFQENTEESVNTVLGKYSREKEYVPFYEECGCSGQVESWLQHCEETVHKAVCLCIMEVILVYEEKQREWAFDYPAEVALAGLQIWWVSDVEMAFGGLEEGLASAPKDCYKKQVTQLNAFITMLLEELSSGDQKIVTSCTMDVHARDDVVESLVAQKVTSYRVFAWLSQLCHRWDDAQQHCFANTCDAQFQYFYEYLGNTPWLVITPLTDRCCITLTQPLHLMMSGTPAGPAGRGETETTKDLSRALGIMVYVFNCSQMDYKLRWNIHKVLVQKGAWGCFDEFNHISVEVLSVVAVQVKTVHDAIRSKKKKPCAVVVSDTELICEIMLGAEGFVDARLFARKLITLYTPCRELLPKQDRYDWALCAVKSVLVVAGSLKGDKNRPEDQVLMRAIRDFSLLKIVTDDIPILMGLISDLFPALDVLRKRNLQFEQMVKQSTLELLLQPEETFVLKVVQLEELLAVRHCVVVGNVGTGKSKVLKILHHKYMNMKQRPVWNDLNPKALTADELFGFIHCTTREWKDSLLSSLLRKQANIAHEGAKWLVLDGDIDPVWIESLNTVMDDNNFKTVTPVSENSMVTLCSLLDCLLTPENVPMMPKELGEMYFIFACIWAFGGALSDRLSDYQAEFSCRWLKKMKAVKFPSEGTVCNYYLDPETRKFLSWVDKVPSPNVDSDAPLQAIFVYTFENAHLKYFIDLLLRKGKPVMLVGNARVGKTVFVGDRLAALSEDKHDYCYYTTSAVLRKMLERKLEKKAGHNYGQVGNKKLIYFIDDLNMPEVDRYGTVQPHALIQQHIDYRHWYDRQKLTIKEIHNCHYIACVNPTAGSFTINPSLQRHFAVFALKLLSSDSLTTIYSKIVCFHFQRHAFTPSVIKNIPAIWLHQAVVQNFPPTAIKFHIFNRRDLSSVCQGILFDTHKCLQPNDLQCLWFHESACVYGDKLMENTECDFFHDMMMDAMHMCFENVEDQVLLQSLLIYHHFGNGRADLCTKPVKEWEPLRNILEEFLESYNEIHASMSQVLFEGAMQHVGIGLILEAPGGYALLIGVGGSGKQSLLRLAAYICSLDIFQITLKKGYGIQGLGVDIASLYIKTGAKNIPTVFLLTDAQVPDERFLVLINDLLASGDVPDLFSDEDMEGIVTAVRKQVRALGLMDTGESCWRFILSRVQLQLKVILCFSPAGSTLQASAREFPAIVNCTAIDWFHEWPREAPRSVSRRLIEEAKGVKSFQKDSNMPNTVIMRGNANYSTPNSLLEQITLYKLLLEKKSKKISGHMEHLVNGMEKLKVAAFQVEDLKSKLASQEAALQLRNHDAEALIAKIGFQTEKGSQEKAIADAEEQKDQSNSPIYFSNNLAIVEELYTVEVIDVMGTKLLETGMKSSTFFVRVLDSNLHKLTASLEKAVAGKVQHQDDVNQTNKTMKLANRLVKGIESENMHWRQSVKNLKAQNKTLCGDVLLTAAFVSYFGPFTKQYCQELMEHFWAFLKSQKVPIPVTEGLDPIATLTDDATIVAWSNEGLPGDRMSTENATILTNCKRWPPIIDPQQQGIKWIKNKYGADLKVVRLGQKGFLKTVEGALDCGETVLIENMGGSIDPILDPLLGRQKVKRGKCIKIEDKECEFNKNFHLILQSKLAHPHYKPGLQAQTTLINFTVSRDGLEDQLLAEVVSAKRLDLEIYECFHSLCLSVLGKQQNHFKMELRQLEDDVLLSPSAAQGSFLDDSELVEKLESTKLTASEIQCKVCDAVFHKASKQAEKSEDTQRISNLTEAVTYSTFIFMSQGLFEKDKLIFLAQTAFQIHLRSKEIELLQLDFLLFVEHTYRSPVDFLTTQPWSAISEKKLGFSVDSGRFHNISLGQGQEMVAEEALEKAARHGHWDTLELCSKRREFKSILFPLCSFHTCIAGRLKFGPQGWDRTYPFSAGDLAVCICILCNLRDPYGGPLWVPWEDLCYLFGEIMYGGLITNTDRRLCCVYLQEFINPPVHALVCLRECERMNLLLLEVPRSLKRLDLGLKGELMFSPHIEVLQSPLFYDAVPDMWTKRAYPSTCSLAHWVTDLLMRYAGLKIWTQDLVLPAVVWLSVLFSPQSFLTAVMQSMAKNKWPLDKVCLTVDVTKKTKEDYGHPSKEGACICGFFMEGARWDIQLGIIAEAQIKELTPAIPVIFVRAIAMDQREIKNVYECPVYKTKSTETTFIWTFNLKSQERPAKWVLAGVALLLAV
ncbi:LOW QUALITY PROTEIN: dynein axonemal heavy chain 11 [Chlamydotis macqueenii]